MKINYKMTRKLWDSETRRNLSKVWVKTYDKIIPEVNHKIRKSVLMINDEISVALRPADMERNFIKLNQSAARWRIKLHKP